MDSGWEKHLLANAYVRMIRFTQHALTQRVYSEVACWFH